MKNYITEDFRRYNYLIFEIDAVYHEISVRWGMPDSVSRILYTLYNLGGDRCPLSDICRLSGMSKQTINSALRKMESEGHIYLESYKGKWKMVCLTEKGKTLVEDTVGHLVQRENEILDEWTEEERKNYLDLTEKYLMAIKEKIREL